MEDWTTPKTISATMAASCFAAFTQIATQSPAGLTPALKVAIGCFVIGIPLSIGFFLRPAALETPGGNAFRKIHDILWGGSVLVSIAGLTAIFWHFSIIFADLFLGAFILATLITAFIGARADKDA
jgi:hypothetical protein